MSSPLAQTIHARLASYLARACPLDEFKDWLVGETWDIEQRADTEAERLTYRIKHRLAEQSGGHITEDDVRRLLRPLVEAAPAPAPA